MCKTAGIYKLLQTAGSGAFGTVYLAENSISGQRMALKILDVSHEKRELAGLILCHPDQNDHIQRLGSPPKPLLIHTHWK